MCMLYFLTVFSQSVGIVPLWGDGPDSVVKDYQRKLAMQDVEMEILYCAQRVDNINSE